MPTSGDIKNTFDKIELFRIEILYLLLIGKVRPGMIQLSTAKQEIAREKEWKQVDCTALRREENKANPSSPWQFAPEAGEKIRQLESKTQKTIYFVFNGAYKKN